MSAKRMKKVSNLKSLASEKKKAPAAISQKASNNNGTASSSTESGRKPERQERPLPPPPPAAAAASSSEEGESYVSGNEIPAGVEVAISGESQSSVRSVWTSRSREYPCVLEISFMPSSVQVQVRCHQSSKLS
ncbi:uncharacterized protein A4U43_C08F31390 [Asparagus officinalis]|nr:uncharacterized protein A4U43_C08F31390 [Asparagus officinalis]